MGQKIDKEVFDKFFKESYCTVEYETVKEEFERIASIGNELFTGSYEARNLNRENFILYLTSDSYCDFEAAVQEAMDDLNPEILDAVMDVTERRRTVMRSRRFTGIPRGNCCMIFCCGCMMK